MRLIVPAVVLFGAATLVAAAPAHRVHHTALNDANIVATMLAHGIRHLLTFNVADFRRFEPMIAAEPLP